MTKKKQIKSNKVRSGAWFVAVRGSYLPASAAGWWTYVPFLAYLIFSGVVGFAKTDSNALAVLFVVPNWVAAVVVETYIAAHNS